MKCRHAVILSTLLGSFEAFGAEASSAMDDLMSLSLEQLLGTNITVASNVVTSATMQPVSISTVSREQIRFSGARTLNEVLSIYVPGFFLVEDQDDTIAGFRGLAPDNNSKVTLLLNGQNMNTEWFWGAPDALLNGIDLEFIERIEVIRGPGSVTLGQGALLGAINIVTRKGSDGRQGGGLAVSIGQDGLQKQALSASYAGENKSAFVYIGLGHYDGQSIPNKGWAGAKYEQGLSVFERNHRLKRSEYTNLFGNFSVNHFEANVFRFQQRRDLYSFYRDREVVEQTLAGANITFSHAITDSTSLKLSTHFAQDDYALYSHGGNTETSGRLEFESSASGFSDVYAQLDGFADSAVTSGLTMGGVREERRGVKAIVKFNDPESKSRMAFGFEYNVFEQGKANDRGHNFIINEEVQTLGLTANGEGGFQVSGDLNKNNTWVKPDSLVISSMFIEEFYHFNKRWNAFAAARYDDHPNWGNHISPRLGVLYSPNKKSNFRISWQTGFRGAVGVQFTGGYMQDGFLAQENFSAVNDVALTEADFDFNGIAADDETTLTQVEPETIESFEFAWHTTPTSNLHFNTVLFWNSVQDILAAKAHSYENLRFGDQIGTDELGTWNGNWYYQNLQGELNQWGMELEAGWKWKNNSLNMSHSHVSVVDAGDHVMGTYVLSNNKISAYPQDVTRVQLRWQLHSSWVFHYNHLYYWGYTAPTETSQDGSHLANASLMYQPKPLPGLDLVFQLKNVWGSESLYPLTNTGDPDGSEGVPASEETTAWLALTYSF